MSLFSRLSAPCSSFRSPTRFRFPARPLAAGVCACCLLGLLSPFSTERAPLFEIAQAHAQAGDVSFSYSTTAAIGQKLTFTIIVNKAISKAVLQLSDGKNTLQKNIGKTAVGKNLVFDLPQKTEGKSDWKGFIDVTFTDNTVGSMELQFQTEIRKIPELVVSEVDIPNNRAVVKLDQTASKVELEVTGDDGELIANTSQDFPNAPAGTPLVVEWMPRTNATVLRLRFVGYNDLGFSSRTWNAYPWQIDIPHEEVVFESNSSVIQGSEEPKLQAVLPQIQTLTKRYISNKDLDLDVKLFVSGHTDSVGGSESNRTLSLARARSIAVWLKKSGIKVPIYIRGYGEDRLRIPTPDETDEVRNRRADYTLSIESPTGNMSGWTLLR